MPTQTPLMHVLSRLLIWATKRPQCESGWYTYLDSFVQQADVLIIRAVPAVVGEWHANRARYRHHRGNSIGIFLESVFGVCRSVICRVALDRVKAIFRSRESPSSNADAGHMSCFLRAHAYRTVPRMFFFAHARVIWKCWHQLGPCFRMYKNLTNDTEF